jgi:hypothetical protein
LSLPTTTFAEGELRQRVLGLNGAPLSGGFTVGALVGGTLVSVPARVKPDLPGAVTVTSGLLSVI